MKKVIYSLLCICLILMCTACSKKGQNPTQSPGGTETKTLEPTIEPMVIPSPEPTPEPTVIPTETPVGVTDLATINGMAEDILNNMTLEEKIGQLFIVNLESLDDSKGNYYEWTKMTKKMAATLEKYNIGGVILFSRNIANREQVISLNKRLQANSKVPMFISVDEEGGDVSRIASNSNMGTTVYPSMSEIGETKEYSKAYEIGSTIGREIYELGFNLDFAPVADVCEADSENGIGNRSFSADAKVTAKMVRSFVEGLQENGVSATLKHFPGQGLANIDTHNGSSNLDRTIEQLRKKEFVPFKAGIKSDVDFIMVSHVSLSRVTEKVIPSCMSSLVLNEIIRMELGFEGVTITDAMNMKAITDEYSASKAATTAICSGADIVLMPEDLESAYSGVLDAVKNGDITEDRINEAVKRILKVKIKRGIIPLDTDLISAKENI